jgi:dTDP-4-dehydrorhamnose 3,5-epimerase
MQFEPTPLQSAFLIRPEPRRDDRGFFARVWCAEELQARGLNGTIAQINVAFNIRRGTLRGLHYQLPPHAECKLIRCTQGAIYNVIVDLRVDSPTHGQWFGAELTADNRAMIYSPEGFANGYQTLVDGTEICYSTTQPFAPQAARGVRFDDRAFDIGWPLPPSCISTQDAAWPDYDPERRPSAAERLTGELTTGGRP